MQKEKENKVFKCKYLDIWNKEGESNVLMQLETTEDEQIQIEFDKYQLIDELSHIEYMKRLKYMKELTNKNKSNNFQPDSINIDYIYNLMYVIKKSHRFDNEAKYIKALEDSCQILFDSIE